MSRWQCSHCGAYLPIALSATLQYVEEYPGLTSVQLAHDFGLSHPAACNRLVALIDRGLLTRTRELIDEGGYLYTYRIAS